MCVCVHINYRGRTIFPRPSQEPVYTSVCTVVERAAALNQVTTGNDTASQAVDSFTRQMIQDVCVWVSWLARCFTASIELDASCLAVKLRAISRQRDSPRRIQLLQCRLGRKHRRSPLPGASRLRRAEGKSDGRSRPVSQQHGLPLWWRSIRLEPTGTRLRWQFH